MSGNNAGNAYSGCLYSKDLVDLCSLKSLLELLTDLIKQTYIHLVVQETIHLENIALLYYSILSYSLFQKIHVVIPP